MLNPFIDILSMAIDLALLALLVWVVLGLLIQFNIVNAHQPVIARVQFTLGRIFNPMLQPIRKYMPDLGGIDLSPIVLILALKFVQSAMYHWLYNL